MIMIVYGSNGRFPTRPSRCMRRTVGYGEQQPRMDATGARLPHHCTHHGAITPTTTAVWSTIFVNGCAFRLSCVALSCCVGDIPCKIRMPSQAIVSVRRSTAGTDTPSPPCGTEVRPDDHYTTNIYCTYGMNNRTYAYRSMSIALHGLVSSL